jgi:hypothetical protein
MAVLVDCLFRAATVELQSRKYRTVTGPTASTPQMAIMVPSDSAVLTVCPFTTESGQSFDHQRRGRAGSDIR